MATPIPTNHATFLLAEILEATGGEIHGAVHPALLRGVSTDTRHIEQGGIFVALRGERFDGHTFAAQAAERGAALLIVDARLTIDVPQVVVKDTLTALGALAAFHRQRWGGGVLAIAGAAGKTTTRCVASALLGAIVGPDVHSTVGNLNNQVGVPMVLLGLQEHHRYAVVEVGTNQCGEVPTLTAMVQPDVSILTLVDLEHTEGLVSLDAIEQEEGAIFGPSCRTLVVNGDDERALRQARAAAARSGRSGARQRILTYGIGDDLDLRLSRRETSDAYTSKLSLERANKERHEVSLGLVGLPAAYAVLAAVVGVEALLGRQLSTEQIQAGIGSNELKPEGRAEIVEGPLGALVINDSYNANPASMQRALQTATELTTLRGGRLHLVLGEMRELGSLSATAHRALAAQVKNLPWVSVFAIGREMLPFVEELGTQPTLDRVAHHSHDTVGVAQQLRQLLAPNDVVLVKGSRGVRTEKVITELGAEGILK